MGRLRQRDTTQQRDLLENTLVGRSRDCWLVLSAQDVSRLHARILWSGGAWILYDLSHNGSSLNGQGVKHAEEVVLQQGDLVSFGCDAETWELCDASEPIASLLPLETGLAIPLTRTPVALPDEETLAGSAYVDVDGFALLETETRVTPLADGQIVELAGVQYRVSLPRTLPSTVALLPTLARAKLVLRGSLNQEHVDASVIVQGRTLPLKARAHLHVLLYLARERSADRAAGLAELEQGWLQVESLCNDLGLERLTLNAHVLRLRRAFAELELADATAIIERRVDSDEIRIGAVELELCD